MRHLFATRAEVLRLNGTIEDGTPIMSWLKLDTVVDRWLGRPGELMCRMDLTFQRPGKDAPMPIVAGRPPDRLGVMFCAANDAIKAGDRIRTIAGPITGTFEIRAIPDIAVGYALGHHIEVQIVEVSTDLTDVFPGGTVGDYIVEPTP